CPSDYPHEPVATPTTAHSPSPSCRFREDIMRPIGQRPLLTLLLLSLLGLGCGVSCRDLALGPLLAYRLVAGPFKYGSNGCVPPLRCNSQPLAKVSHR